MIDTATDPAAGEAAPETGKTPATPPAADPPAPSTETPEAPAEGAEAKPEARKEGEADKKPNRVSAEERIKQATRRQRMAERERDRALAEIERLRATPKPQKPIEEMDYEEREAERIRRVMREEREQSARSDANEFHAEVVDARGEAVMAALEAESERLPGLADKLLAIKLSQATVDYLSESEKAADIAHHLVTHPDVARRIFNLTNPRSATAASLRQADREMARIEASIGRGTARRATTAPDPGTTLNGGSTPQSRSLEELAKSEDASDYIARRKAAWAKGKH